MSAIEPTVMENSSIPSNKAVFKSLLQRVAAVPPAYYALAVLIGTAAFVSPHLLDRRFALIILRQGAPLGVAALAQSLVMRAGTIDLSISGIYALTIYLVSSGTLDSYPPAFLVIVPIVLGIVVGFTNGILIAKVRASAVITTLGVTTVLTGVVLMLSAGGVPGEIPSWLRILTNGNVGGVSYAVLVWVALSALVAAGLRFTIFGRYLNAIGENSRAAALSGLPVPRVIIATHTLAGLISALGAILHTSSLGVGSIKPGLDIVMMSIASTILGGVTFGSGRGGVAGPFVAVIVFGYLFAMLTVFGVQEPGKLIVQGVIIAAAAIGYGIRSR
jgi:ribose transport system permease protein